MGKEPEDLTEEEAKRRFERAVDAALHTAPMHRESKKPTSQPAKKAKDKGTR